MVVGPGSLVTLLFVASLQLILWLFIAPLYSKFQGSIPFHNLFMEIKKYIKKVDKLQTCHLKKISKTMKPHCLIEQKILAINGKSSIFYSMFSSLSFFNFAVRVFVRHFSIDTWTLQEKCPTYRNLVRSLLWKKSTSSRIHPLNVLWRSIRFFFCKRNV